MKYYGKIGFEVTSEDPVGSGVWTQKITDIIYPGEVLSNRYRRDEAGKVNDDLTLSHRISIVADMYAYRNFNSIVYVEFMGTKWKVRDIEVEYPRLHLTLGGLYNGEK